MTGLETTIGGLAMSTPVLLASGVVGYGTEYAGLVDLRAVGAIVTKTITAKPRAGNKPPRLRETDGGLLNAIGLENVGLPAFLEEKLPEAGELGVPIVASIAGVSPDECGTLAGAIGARHEVAAIEINISCPNVERPRRPVWADPQATAAVVEAARGATGKVLLVKLSPNAADVLSVAEAAERAGADALVVANTLPAMRVDLEKRAPALGNVTGGLSGNALMPVNLALVWKVSEVAGIPIVGSGGISSASHALEYLMAGASAFQIGTALFAEPEVPSRIVEGLKEYMKRDGAGRISEYVGLAHKEGAPCGETITAG
jgi:dihydroorotate dehydrogenase (NAD+) catalytic subunit